MRIRIASALAAVLVLTARLAAQVPYIESVEVRVHSVDVVVTDDQGRPVRGLTRDDFQLLEDGKAKPITNFSAFAGLDRPATTGGSAATPATSTAPLLAAEGTSSTEGTPPPRKFIFFIDEMSLSQPTARKLKRELDRIFMTTMRPGDEAMIVRPAEEKKLTLPFSRDLETVRQTLKAAIDRENWRATAPILREQRQLEIEMRGTASGPATRAAGRRWANFVRNRVQQRLGQLRAVVTASGDVPGRKVLVLVTESLPLEPGKEAFTARLDAVSTTASEAENTAFGDWSMISDFTTQDWVSLAPLVDEIARSAATNGVTIYPIHAEYGLGLAAPGGDIGGTTPGREAWGNPTVGQRARRASDPIAGTMGNFPMLDQLATNTENTLRTLAEKTGGTWRRGGLSFDDLVNAMATDVSSYYSLGYHAGDEVDVPHRLEVRVKGRPELKVRARQEVIRKSPQREMTDRVVASLLSPVPTNELGIRLESRLIESASDKKVRMIWVAARVPLSKLTFVPDGDKLKASFSVHYAVLGERSDFVSGVHGTQVVEMPAADYEAKKDEVWTYVVPFHFTRSRNTVAVGVLDVVSRLSGFGRLELDVK
jgi:VWFA-related protein